MQNEMNERKSANIRAAWFVIPPALYFVLALILIRFRCERALEFISYPGLFIGFLAGLHGHGGYELVLLPNLVLHVALGGISSYMGKPARKYGLYVSCLILMAGLAHFAGSLQDNEARQTGEYRIAQRTSRERVPAQRKRLVEEDFSMGVKMWDNYCAPNIKLEERLPHPGTPHCPDASSYFQSAVTLASPEQSATRCLAQLYLAVSKAIASKGIIAQEAFGEWKKCTDAPRTDNTIALEGIYERFIVRALKAENLERKAHEQWLKR